ncbi:hypothetical protein [Mycobacterium florentinum]|nr:hypothetical protein [Mycobacterium florentinum]
MCINQFAVRTRDPGLVVALLVVGRPRQPIRRLVARIEKATP